MNDFLPVSMRDITKSASESGRTGWDEVGGLVNIQNAVREVRDVFSKKFLCCDGAFFFLTSFILLHQKEGMIILELLISLVHMSMKCNKQYLENVALKINVKMYNATSFYEAIPVVDYVQRLLNLRDPSQPLSDSDRIKAVKGLRVELTHRKEGKCNKISGITTQPVEQLMFTVDEGEQRMSMAQYFHDKYHVKLRYGHWPAFQAGSDSKPAYLPMDVCKIVEGQRYSKKLNEKQVTAMLRLESFMFWMLALYQASQAKGGQYPNALLIPMSVWMQMALHNDYKNDRFAKEFGIEVIPG
ncbi:hypothetical protein IFM89_009520 [Coptis chinensis]|uniref:PAZ domain-containing protein n=1 Tax=Coptis chinensis TaxID=261450 RepID=A0A835HSU4_9MAGN|nr:hypothetical protein IFM89_009520 [Coptis chinensis]